jgi:dephospho-CoA kinase
MTNTFDKDAKKKLVIAVSGTLCSGKGLVAKILKSRGCDIDTFSSVVKNELYSRRIEITRTNLQDEGNRLRKEFGGQVLAERLLAKYERSTKPLVIDGLRNIGELEYLKKHSNCILIGVDAPLEFRWELTQKRKSEKDLIGYDTFVELDARDKGYNEPLNGQQVGMCLTHADFLIYNDEEFDRLENSKFYKQVIEIYEEILKKR